MMSIKLCVGLGNPGTAYEETRHNAGQWFLRLLAERWGVSLRVDKKLQAHTGTDLSRHVHLMMPLSYMNESGLSVRAISQFYRILPEEMLIVHDDLDVPVGRFKLKTGGGHGGHNGLRDVMAHLGHDSFHRLRIGIGHPGHKDAVLHYVLDKPSVVDMKAIHQIIDDIIPAMTDVLALKFSHVTNNIST